MNSQHNEEEIIREFFRGQTGTFLDVGAFDGVTDSNTHALSNNGWAGVYVEPNLETFRKLRKAKGEKFICLHGACGRTEGIHELKTAQTPELSTLHPETPKLQHLAHEFNGSEYVQVWTINQLQSRFGDFKFISIDAEGLDFDVICGAMNALLSTELVCLEKGLPGHRSDEPAFKNQNFKIVDLFRRIGWEVHNETEGNFFFSSPMVRG